VAPSLPSDIYLDTSIVVAATIAGIAHAGPSQQFCERLGIFGARVYVSTLLRLEFVNALRSLALPRNPRRPRLPEATRQQFRLQDWETAAAVREAWMGFGEQQLEAFFDQFAEAIELPLRAGTAARTVALMCQYNMKSYDAVHVAVATENGLRDFASTDREFRPVQGLQLWLARDDEPPLV
jgi:predicted nucleic acid-binding protein